MSLPEIVMVTLNKIRPNPWRDFVLNPIDAAEVALLEASIDSTKEFWVGVYGRKVPGGFVELAFGHNRLEAAKNKKRTSIPIAVRELTDEEMLVRMVKENEQSDLSFRIALEAVSAAVRALAEGKIGVPAPERTNPASIRYAPSFVPDKKPTSGTVPEVPYTASTLAVFLGGAYATENKGHKEPQHSVKAALAVLEAIERKVIVDDKVVTPARFDGMPVTAISTEAHRMIKQHERLQMAQTKTAEQITEYNAGVAENARLVKEAEKVLEDAQIAKNLADAAAKRDKENKEKEEQKRLTKDALDAAEEEAKEARKDLVIYEREGSAKIKEAEEEQKREEKKAAYENILSGVHSVVGVANRTAEEHGAFYEKVRTLSKKDITLSDRQRVITAFQEAAVRCERLGNLMEVSLKGLTKIKREKK